MARDVVVVTGLGEMGQAIARQVGHGADLVLADRDPEILGAAAASLRGEGYVVTPVVTDVSVRESMAALASVAASRGEVRAVVHTAGVSPMLATVPAILAVNLLGVALVIEEFGRVIAAGGAGVVISSMSAYLMPALTDEELRQLATTPTDQLLDLPIAAPAAFASGGLAYSFTKRANQVQVQAGSARWGARGARINTISPGIIDTAQGQAELRGAHGASMRAMIDSSSAGRLGTPTDIAAAVEFLLSPAASFISGIDLLVDGGVVAARHTAGRPDRPTHPQEDR